MPCTASHPRAGWCPILSGTLHFTATWFGGANSLLARYLSIWPQVHTCTAVKHSLQPAKARKGAGLWSRLPRSQHAPARRESLWLRRTQICPGCIAMCLLPQRYAANPSLDLSSFHRDTQPLVHLRETLNPTHLGRCTDSQT